MTMFLVGIKVIFIIMNFNYGLVKSNKSDWVEELDPTYSRFVAYYCNSSLMDLNIHVCLCSVDILCWYASFNYSEKFTSLTTHPIDSAHQQSGYYNIDIPWVILDPFA